LLFLSSRALSIYISALWFGSLGYASVYWYMFKLKIELFLIFFILTALILRVAFWLIDRAFASFDQELMKCILEIPERILHPEHAARIGLIITKKMLPPILPVQDELSHVLMKGNDIPLVGGHKDWLVIIITPAPGIPEP